VTRTVQLLQEGRASVAEVVDLDDLEGDYDDEEDGDGVTSVDVSVKFEQLEDEESQSLLKYDLHAAAGGSGALVLRPHRRATG
jgi:hypothetical protein